ncbi:MAG: hypothetical protein MUF34_36245 [Polyangiaceae bacterium]|nr:hypothetical protein [Polyangiaceae bacterium]
MSPAGVPSALEPAGAAGQVRPVLPPAPGPPPPGALAPDAPAGTPASVEGAPAPVRGSGRGETARTAAPSPPTAPDVYLRRRKPRPLQLEIGPSLLYSSRVTRGEGPSYKDAIALSFSARARIVPWLFVGARYRTVAHILYLPPGSFGLPGQEFDDSRRTYVRSLDAYLHPTIEPVDSLRLWATVGLGWGQITLPPILTTKPAEGATLRPRRGVFGEAPLGVGAAYNLPWRWLSVSCEGLFEPVFYQEGNMYEPLRYVNRASNASDFIDATPMPKLRHSFAGIVGLSFAL